MSFFFFQAEDGIRDVAVTGVQTCALPISYLFRRAGTTPNPTKPTSALVIWGPYRFTRNPMYVGMATLYVGGTLLLNDLWPLALLPVVIALVQRRVIAKEEAYLEIGRASCRKECRSRWS